MSYPNKWAAGDDLLNDVVTKEPTANSRCYEARRNPIRFVMSLIADGTEHIYGGAYRRRCYEQTTKKLAARTLILATSRLNCAGLQQFPRLRSRKSLVYANNSPHARFASWNYSKTVIQNSGR